MNNTELKLVPLGSSDVITSSGPLSESLTLAKFGNNNKGDATVTGYFKGQTINFDNSRDGGFMNYIAGLYGDDFKNVRNYFGETPFKYGTGQRDSFSSLDSVISAEGYTDSDSGSGYSYYKYNGTYTFDSLSNMFIKQ